MSVLIIVVGFVLNYCGAVLIVRVAGTLGVRRMEKRMSERVDHVMEAHKLLNASLDEKLEASSAGFATSNALVTRAHVQATLALVEQRRIANILKVDEMHLRHGYGPNDEVEGVLGL